MPWFTAHRMLPMVVVAGFVFAALLMGVVTATGNLMATGLVLGVVMGVLMLSAVNAIVWIIIAGTLFVAGPFLLFFPQYARVNWLFSMLGFFLVFAAIAYAGTAKHVRRAPSPAFVPIMIAFAVFAVGSLFYSDSNLAQGAGAIKRNFQFLGLVLALAFVPLKAHSIRSWLVFLLALGLIQLPFALYQRVVLVPMRLNLPNRVVPVDIVAGTFEASMFGGGNNIVMAFFVLLVVMGILSIYRERAFSGFKTLLLLGVAAAPLGLGETKMVLALMPVALFAIFMDLIRKRPALFALGSVVAAAVLGGLFYVYIAIQGQDTRTLTFEQRLQENIDYNFGNAGYFDGPSLNRSSVVRFWWDKNGTKDPIKTVFGHGLGSSFSVPGADTPGHLNLKYPGHSIDLTGVSTLLWDVGLFGLLLYLLAMGSAWFCSRKLIERAAPGLDRALCRTLSASIAMLGVMLLASNVMLWAPSMQVLMMLTFGLLAWRWRRPDWGDE
jgi:hypothetical protein